MGAEYLMLSFNFALKFPDEEPFSAGWVLQHVFAPVARKLSLPFAIKCGTRRGANARLRQVGDGVSSFDVGVLNRLCPMFPDVKFLATILIMDNQHELAATARKFANHRLYGCWWFCNNPSLIHLNGTCGLFANCAYADVDAAHERMLDAAQFTFTLYSLKQLHNCDS